MKQHENDVRFLERRAPFTVVSFKAETFPRFLDGKAAFLKGKATFLKGRAALLKGRCTGGRHPLEGKLLSL